MTVASVSINFAFSVNGEHLIFFASSRISLAAAVFPTPGEP